MDDIQRKKFKEFLIMLNDIMVDFALLLTLASELYDDFSAEAMITQENKKIAFLLTNILLHIGCSIIKSVKLIKLGKRQATTMNNPWNAKTKTFESVN